MNKPIVMHIPKDKKVIIIEGIAGSGKSTFFKDYKESIKDKMVYAYTEEELLFGWRHNFIPGITDVRLRYFEKILDYIDLKLKNEDCIFILERFHISLKIFNWDSPTDFEERYSKIMSRIKSLPVQVLIFTLESSQIIDRQVTKEKAWHEYQELKKRVFGFANKCDFYLEEQKTILNLASKFNISYSIIKH